VRYVAVDLVKWNPEIVVADVTSLPFPDGDFDFVVCFNVLCAVAEDIQAVSEMGRVCKEGGSVVLSEAILRDSAGEPVERTVEFGGPDKERHASLRYYGRDFASRFSQPGLHFVEDRYALDLPQDTITRYGLSRRVIYTATKQLVRNTSSHPTPMAGSQC
jgi:SAM-dependent methyltransferase